MKEIREWLENGGQPYAQGVALYAAHGSSRVVLSALQYGETEFTRHKLRVELGRLVEGAPAAPAPAPAAVAPVAGPPAPADETLRYQRSSWYAERHRLHAQLELLPTDEERRAAAERILVLSELLTASYQPAAAPAPRPDLSGLSDQGEIRRLLNNLRPQRTRLKKNPARTLDLQQVEAAIKILETKLLQP